MNEKIWQLASVLSSSCHVVKYVRVIETRVYISDEVRRVVTH
jgi:hypothetical protein